jgi:hypothetical protein
MQQAANQIDRPMPVTDVGEGAVLPLHEHTRVKQDGDEELRLERAEAEPVDSSRALIESVDSDGSTQGVPPLGVGNARHRHGRRTAH